MQERTGKARPELETDQPPAPLAYLLEWFYDLNGDRQSNGFGPASITSGMILDWARGREIRLRPRDFDALRLLNRIWLNIWAELNPTESSSDNK